ncbi:hypothetical protein HPB49_024232 [Dermacentor silvarum]|uniref:Uncharacterized protein n=2 Tax=Dermacentor silvarum TaxID=543639 RepID=A0ACB8D8V4_DERSI|nr:hypothetical protein HPB49_020887 [Dermacentor silvarum]KAH7960889.1 hypothetical protein HPB49_024232 [Dermacentor silvarum]
MARRRRDSHSFAPGSRTVYPSGPKASLCAALKDEDLRKKSERNLYTDDKTLTVPSAVYEHHFEPHLVRRDYVSVVNSNELQIPRGKPSLAPDAVPTLLPGCPTYLYTTKP